MSSRKKQKIEVDVPIVKYMTDLFEPKTISSVQSAWRTKNTKKCPVDVSDNLQIIQNPFPLCTIRNFVSTKLINDALREMPNVKFYEKSNDLYQFKQSGDVANIKGQPGIGELYRVFSDELRQWVQETFAGDKKLKPEISATFSCYEYGDRLLCHDDKCEVRHTAFVLYLTSNWTKEDGGNLELFNTNADGDPHEVVYSIPATYNTLVLFQVTPTSFHQVSEILCKDKKRLSLNGWFHCDCELSPVSIATTTPPSLLTILPTASEFLLEDFCLVNYLKFSNQLDIKQLFITNSEIQLDEILLPAMWTKVCDDLQSEMVEWSWVGPANIRHYEVADPSSFPSYLSNLWALLQSRTWLRFLKSITGLDMVPSTNSDTQAWNEGRQPTCRVEVQRWTNGCYSLIHDGDPEFHTAGMDAFLRAPFAGVDVPSHDLDTPEPGHIVYLDKLAQDEECLLHLGYKMNSLGLIFRDIQTLRFTKYLDSTATPFYQIQCLYIPWAPPSENPRLKHVDSGSETEPDPSDADDDDDDDDDEEFADENGTEVITLNDFDDDSENEPSCNGENDASTSWSDKVE